MYAMPPHTSGTQFAAQTVGGADAPEQPADRQHAQRRDRRDDADRNVLFDARQRGVPPARRAREAAMADASPPATGLTSLIRLHSAAMPIAPAPMNRTWWLQTPVATCSSEPVAACSAVRYGTATPQAIDHAGEHGDPDP